MSDILYQIVKYKKTTLKTAKKHLSLNKLKSIITKLPKPRCFISAIKRKSINVKLNIIAEVKHKSPSAGVIKPNFDHVKIAKKYEQSGVKAISVITEEKYFGGSLKYLYDIKNSVRLPVLRKDFVFDKYQVYESRAFGADAILLIASILEKKQIEELFKTATSIGLDVITEVHNESELKKVLSTSVNIIGINNRNLKSFKVDFNTTLQLLPNIPKKYVVISESGIKNKMDIDKLSETRVDAVLIGETLMRTQNVKSKLKNLGL